MALLVLWQHAGYHGRSPHLGADGSGGALVVAGEHHALDAHGRKLGHGAGTARLDPIRQGDKPQETVLPSKVECGLALVGELLGESPPGVAHGHASGLHHAQVAGEHRRPLDGSAHALTRYLHKISDRQTLRPVRHACHDGLGQRVLAQALHARRHRQQAGPPLLGKDLGWDLIASGYR